MTSGLHFWLAPLQAIALVTSLKLRSQHLAFMPSGPHVKGMLDVNYLLCHVFKKVCVKIVDPTIMGELKKEVAICLVLLE